MDDSVLWIAALGIAALGFLLLAVAGMVAMYLNTRAPSAKDAVSTKKPKSRTKDVGSTDKSRPHVEEAAPSKLSQPRAEDAASNDESRLRAGSPRAERKTVGGFWAWIKAWIFALVHAGTVSVVFGGITFFEDLANASDEIERTGTVTFPKQLLPGTLSGPVSRERLVRPASALLGRGRPRGADQLDEGDEDPVEPRDLNRPTGSPPDVAGWEIVDPADETGAGQSRVVEDPHSIT
jgi:hypothetical protein